MQELKDAMSKVPDSVLNGWSQDVKKWKRDYHRCKQAINQPGTKARKFVRLANVMKAYK